MSTLIPTPRRRRGRAAALVTALSLVVAPLLVTPQATAAVVTTETSDEPTATTTDVVAPAADQLVVDGALQVGEEVTIDPRPELWAPADVELAFTYRWFAGDAVVAESEGRALRLDPATVGQQVSVEVIGTAVEGTVDGASSATVRVLAAGTVAEGVFVAPAPEISGTAAVGQTLTASAGAWEPAASLGYQWLRDQVAIGGATGPTYTLTPDDRGSTLSVRVSGSSPGYTDLSLTSNPTTAVVEADLVSDVPTILGTVRVGSKVTALPGDWTAGTALSYQWVASGATISGATSSTYTPTASVVGKALAVRVTGTKAGYASATASSAETKVAPGVLSAATPTLSGTVRVGSKVTAKPGAWTSGTSLSYQWYASGSKISGATSSTYTPSSGAKGKTLTVKVTGKKSGYTTVTRTSAGTKVAAGVLSAPKPTIKGTVKVGGTVSVARGTWKPGATSYRYQWKVGGTSVKGATRSSYTIPAKYAGKKLTVTVTGSRSGYTTRSVTSSSATVLRVYSRTSAPKVSGTVRVGSTLKVSSKGTWSPAPTSWKYQWKANGTAIKGATRSTFTLTSAQHGKKITVTVSGVRRGYATSSRTSAATVKVAWPVGVSTPKVTNQPDARSVKTGTSVRFSASATGGRLTYQWQARTAESDTWTNVSGKTSSSYTFTARSKHTLTEFRLRVSNVAGTVYSKPATLWVDSSRTDPYAPGQWFVANFWMQSLWDTEAGTADGVPYVDAWFVGCSLGDPALSIWDDLAISYVGSDGRTYSDTYGYPQWSDDGCEQIAVEVDGVSRGAASGGVWKIVDHSGSWMYGTSTQWVRGLS